MPSLLDSFSSPLISGRGSLISVSIAAEPYDLEFLLDRLGESQYPIDPQIDHNAARDGRPVTVVEFAAYDSWLNELRPLLETCGTLTVRQWVTHPSAA